MGETPDQTVSEIEQTRRRLDAELAELETYLPPTTAWLKRAGAIAAGAIAGVALLAFVVRKRGERRTVRRLRSIDRRLEGLQERMDEVSASNGRRR